MRSPEQLWVKLKQEMSGKPIVVIGEIHGIAVNPKILEEFVTRLKVKSAGVELPVDWKDSLLDLVAGSEAFARRAKGTEPERAGIIGKEHLSVFAKLAARGVTLFPFRENKDDWNETDRLMADCLKQHCSGQSPVVVQVGNFHARKNPFTLEENPDYKFIPMASHLMGIVTTVQIRYAAATMRNFEKVTELQDKETLSLIEKNGIGLMQSDNPDFDYYYLVDRSKALTRF